MRSWLLALLVCFLGVVVALGLLFNGDSDEVIENLTPTSTTTTSTTTTTTSTTTTSTTTTTTSTTTTTTEAPYDLSLIHI